MQVEGTSKLVDSSQIESLQSILSTGENPAYTFEETEGIAYDLITLYELLAEKEPYEQQE